MNIYPAPQLRTEDFQEQQEWISKLFIQLNPFFSSLQSFSQNIDFSTNIQSTTYQTTQKEFQKFSFMWPFPFSVPVTCQVVQALRGDSQTPTNLLCQWSFDNSSDLITIFGFTEVTPDYLGGLNGFENYIITIRATI